MEINKFAIFFFETLTSEYLKLSDIKEKLRIELLFYGLFEFRKKKELRKKFLK